ncbi:MAG TPA: hypothetical protein VN943_05405 [Candidatus Acidoferrum sp.]|nr:hypothetical protein [Candidatus Acidoferrum sp.]
MRFARVRCAAVMLAAAHFFLSSSPALSQIRSLRAATPARPAVAFPPDLPECAGEAKGLPAPFRSPAARCNSLVPEAAEASVHLPLLALGARGLAIEQAREHVIAILSTENSCSAWFREVHPDSAAIFESLDFFVDDGPKHVVASKSTFGEMLFKHPYSARVQENAGYNAVVLLNANGPFFATAADVLERRTAGGLARFAGRRTLRVGSYEGSTLPARITTLLHELGHVIGRLPDDSDELSGLSAQNTEHVLHACRAEIKASARPHRDKSN